MLGSDIPRSMQLAALGLDGDYIQSANRFGIANKPVLSLNGHQKDGQKDYYNGGKLPWHPTFSDESPFSTKEYQGGKWVNAGDTFYTPSNDMLNGNGKINPIDMDRLQHYFNKHEQGNVLVSPAPRLKLN